MASLALIVSLIFLSLITLGPLSYIVSKFNCIPNLLKYLLGILCGAIGLWAIFIPVPLFKYRDWETDRKSTRLNSSHRL